VHGRGRRPLHRAPVRPAGQRGGRGLRRRRRPPRLGGAASAAAVGGGGGPRPARRPGAPHQAQQAAGGRRHGAHGGDPRHLHRGHRGLRRPRPLHPGRPAALRDEAAAGEVPGLRLVLAAVRRGAARPGRGRTGDGPAGRLGPAGE
jgi:hypothetical protein